MSRITLFRLWVMVFLEYFIFGAWYVTMGTYLTIGLGFDGGRVGLAYGSLALAATIAPFFVGMVADRFFATEKILATLHLLGAALLLAVAQLTTFATFYPVLLAYALGFTATLALTNSLSLHHLDDPDRQFPVVMLMGSLGWIVAGLVIGQLEVESTAVPFRIAAMASAFMGVYCLTLPRTPPQQASAPVTIGGVLGFDALKLLKEPSFAVFVVGSFLLCIPLSFYFSWTNVFLNEIGVDRPASKMTLGQVSDVIFLLLMPWLLGRLGVKKMLLLGMLAWALRFFAFAVYAAWRPEPALLYAGILVHGIAYGYVSCHGPDLRRPQGSRPRSAVRCRRDCSPSSLWGRGHGPGGSWLSLGPPASTTPSAMWRRRGDASLGADLVHSGRYGGCRNRSPCLHSSSTTKPSYADDAGNPSCRRGSLPDRVRPSRVGRRSPGFADFLQQPPVPGLKLRAHLARTERLSRGMSPCAPRKGDLSRSDRRHRVVARVVAKVSLLRSCSRA